MTKSNIRSHIELLRRENFLSADDLIAVQRELTFQSVLGVRGIYTKNPQKTFNMSAVQSDKVCVCDSCGLSLPTVTPIVATEPVGDAEPVVVVEPEVIAAVEVAVEPEVIASPKMDAESNTTIQLDELKEVFSVEFSIRAFPYDF